MKDARQVAWSYIADQNGRYIDADDFEAQVVALTKIIEADRASRGTGEREEGRREALEQAAVNFRDSAERLYDMMLKEDYGHKRRVLSNRSDERFAVANELLALRGPAPAEPPTGHLEVAVRALAKAKLDLEGDAKKLDVVRDISRALAALRAAPAGEMVRREDVVRWLRTFPEGSQARHLAIMIGDGQMGRDLAALDPHAYVSDGKKRCEVCGGGETDEVHVAPDSAGDAGTGENGPMCETCPSPSHGGGSYDTISTTPGTPTGTGDGT